MKILEDEYGRAALGDRLQEPPPRSECLATPVFRHVGASEPDERSEVTLDPRPLTVVRENGDDIAELRRGRVGVIRLEDPGVRLDDLAERPVGDAFTVWQAAPLAPRDQLVVHIDDASEFEHEAALSDTRDPDQSDELGRLVAA